MLTTRTPNEPSSDARFPRQGFNGTAGRAESADLGIADAAGGRRQGQDHARSLSLHDPPSRGGGDELRFHRDPHGPDEVFHAHLDQRLSLSIHPPDRVEGDVNRSRVARHVTHVALHRAGIERVNFGGLRLATCGGDVGGQPFHPVERTSGGEDHRPFPRERPRNRAAQRSARSINDRVCVAKQHLIVLRSE
jgi:hypothetical protein